MKIPKEGMSAQGDPLEGVVKWSFPKSIWMFGMYTGSVAAFWHTNLSAFCVFLFLSALTLCFGLSLGIHRRLIHRSYECPRWLEYIFVYLGTLVGIAGPLSLIRIHNTREWAQLQPRCHDYFAHRRGILLDWWWLLHCRFDFEKPPQSMVPTNVTDNRYFRILENTWMFQQIPLGIALYFLGGPSWVLWGICVRVSASVTAHWYVCYLAHHVGSQKWHVKDAGVQGFDVPFCGLITMGECWHNCHHAYPESAKFGLLKGQIDPGWWAIIILKRLGLAWNIVLPDVNTPRSELKIIPVLPHQD